MCDRAATRALGPLCLFLLLSLVGFSSSRRDNFNLNKWSGGRHLCPRLVLFILDYSERTCAAVSSAGRVRCLLSRVNVFQNPPGIYTWWYTQSRPGLTLSRSLLPRLAATAFCFCVDLCDREQRRLLIIARASGFVILCPAELRLRARG